MKNSIIRIAVLLCAVPVLLTSCLKDQEDVFDDSSNSRMQQTLKETKDVLMSAANGWVIDYYAGINAAYGGYAFAVKFDESTCTAVSERITEPCTSYYKLTTDNGPVLTFDTYNKVLHDMATPSMSNYEGKNADFEFLVMSATPEMIVLKGKKTQNVMRMFPLSMPAGEYVEKVRTMADEVVFSTAKGLVGGKEVEAKFDVDNRQVKFVTTEPADSISVPFTYTDKGIRLQSFIGEGSYAFDSFSFDSENTRLMALNAGGQVISMDCFRPENWRDYITFEGEYTLYTAGGKYSVSLVPSEDGTGYLMKGLNSKFDILCNYSKGRGALTISTQLIGEEDGVQIQLALLDTDGSYLSWSPEVGLVISANVKNEKEYIVTSNGYEDFVSGGLILWCFQDGESLGGADVRDFFSSHKSWLISGDYVLDGMTRMVKK